MWENWKEYIIATAIAIAIVAILVILSGCALLESQTTAISLPQTAADHMWKSVARTNWFGTFCLLSFFGGIVAVSLGQKKIGGAIVMASIATVCFGLAIHRFPTWLAIIGFTSSIIAVGYSILIKNKALVEIIKGVQDYRNTIDTYHIDIGLKSNQSKSTKKIVKQIKVAKQIKDKEKI